METVYDYFLTGVKLYVQRFDPAVKEISTIIQHEREYGEWVEIYYTGADLKDRYHVFNGSLLDLMKLIRMDHNYVVS